MPLCGGRSRDWAEVFFLKTIKIGKEDVFEEASVDFFSFADWPQYFVR